MNDRINESDILALIEGDLPADRRAIVAEALRTDAQLRARVEGMIRDAQTLAHDQTDPPPAPSGVIARAFEHADAPVAVVAPKSRRRFAMAAIITLALVGVWGAILYATFGPDINRGNPAKVRPERWMMVDEEQADHLADVLNPPEIAQYGDMPEGTETLGDLIADNAGNVTDDVVLDPEIEQMLRDFTALADNATPLEEAAPRIAQLIALDPSAITVGQIVTAARQGRLRIVFEDRDPAALIARSAPASDAWATRTTTIAPDSPEFVRDYAKPAPGSEDRPPTRTLPDAPVTRLDVALTSATDEPARDRDAARLLNAVITAMTNPTEDSPRAYARFIIEDEPVAAADDQRADWDATLPENASLFTVYFQQESDD